MQTKLYPISFFSSSAEQTALFAKELSKNFSPGTILCLEGDLGAGKTTFSKAFIRAVAGVEEDAIQSPTFIYQNTYTTSNFSIHHFDLYRLQNEREFIEMGFLDSFNSDSICLIEWPCKITSLLESYLLITIRYISETERMINIEFIERTPCQ